MLFRLKVEGEDYVPASNGVILASNHICLLDPPVIGIATARELNYLAKAELFDQPILGWIITGLNAFPVKRGGIDRNALKKMVGLLRRGKALLLFPEGTRSKRGELGRAKSGVGMLALKTETPVVPVHISGPKSFFRVALGGDRIWVKFGQPLFPADFRRSADHRCDYQLLVQQVMSKIKTLAEEKEVPRDCC